MTTEVQLPLQASIDVSLRQQVGRLDPNIYGHFLESSFFGNIDGGVFDEGSPLSTSDAGVRNGLRQDVLELCRELNPQIVRWPGGNFTSPYRWEDGVGPRDDRPRRLELAWGSEESNRFGTDEFLAWCADAGAEPYLAHSCRDVDDAVRWVEYTNYAGDTYYTRRRAANGRAEPYGVQYWGIGNETYGPWQMGFRSADQYAADAREHALFMRRVDPSIKLVAVGIPWRQEEWTRPVLEAVGHLVDYISLHLYGASTHLYTAASGDDDYEAVVAQALYFEQRINDYAEIVASLAKRSGIERPLALSVDEWNIRHLEPSAWPEPEASDDGGFAARDVAPDAATHELRVNRWSPRTLADALFYAGVFHALHRASGLTVPPTMANTVNLVNANGVVVARPGGAVRSASHHVWNLYRNHTGPVAVPAAVDGPSSFQRVRYGDSRDGQGGFVTSPATVPHLDVSATTSEDGRRLYLVVINRRRDTAIRAQLSVDGQGSRLPTRASVRDLGADVDDVLAHNTLSKPDEVALRNRGQVELEDGCYTFAAHSLTVLSFDM